MPSSLIFRKKKHTCKKHKNKSKTQQTHIKHPVQRKRMQHNLPTPDLHPFMVSTRPGDGAINFEEFSKLVKSPKLRRTKSGLRHGVFSLLVGGLVKSWRLSKPLKVGSRKKPVTLRIPRPQLFFPDFPRLRETRMTFRSPLRPFWFYSFAKASDPKDLKRWTKKDDSQRFPFL